LDRFELTVQRLFSLEGRTAIVIGARAASGRFTLHGLRAHALRRWRERVNGLRTPARGRLAAPATSPLPAFEAAANAGPERTRRLAYAVRRSARPRLNLEEERFDRTIDSTAPCTGRIARDSCGAREGSIINVTSVNSVLGFPANLGYVAAKGLGASHQGTAIDLPSNVRERPALGISDLDDRRQHADPAQRETRIARMIIPAMASPTTWWARRSFSPRLRLVHHRTTFRRRRLDDVGIFSGAPAHGFMRAGFRRVEGKIQPRAHCEEFSRALRLLLMEDADAERLYENP
jgi:hypothetical protein